MRQSIIAVAAMALVVAVAAFDEWTSRAAAPKVQISGAVTQWSSLGQGGSGEGINFRVGPFPFDLSIAGSELQLLAKHGVTQPVTVGAQVEAIVVKSEVMAARDRAATGAAQVSAVPVLALRVNGQPMFGAPEAFRLRRSMTTWPYLLLLSAFGATLFFGNRRRRRRIRR
jgi:hypothetical protein